MCCVITASIIHNCLIYIYVYVTKMYISELKRKAQEWDEESEAVLNGDIEAEHELQDFVCVCVYVYICECVMLLFFAFL